MKYAGIIMASGLHQAYLTAVYDWGWARKDSHTFINKAGEFIKYSTGIKGIRDIKVYFAYGAENQPEYKNVRAQIQRGDLILGVV
jgi:hypothetical protein